MRGVGDAGGGRLGGRNHRGDLQAHSGTWVLGHLHVVLLAVELVDHVVGHGAVFIKVLRGATLHIVYFGRGGTFDFVAQDGATNETNCCGQGIAFPFADGVTHHTAGDSAHGRTSARFAGLSCHLLLGTDLTGNCHLLDDGHSGNYATDFLCTDGGAESGNTN